MQNSIKNLATLLATTTLLTLSACSSTPSSTSTTATPTTETTNAQADVSTEFYKCDNGYRPRVDYLDVNTIKITVDDKSATLTTAQSASGVKYTSNTGLFGYGATWSSKKGEAIFEFKNLHGNAMETFCDIDKNATNTNP